MLLFAGVHQPVNCILVIVYKGYNNQPMYEAQKGEAFSLKSTMTTVRHKGGRIVLWISEIRTSACENK